MGVAVARLSITPVKSTALRHPVEVRLEAFGVLDNRRFYVAQPDGRMFNNTKLGPLMRIHAEWRHDDGSEWLTLRLPDGSVADGDPRSLGDPVMSDFYGRAVSGRVVEGPFGSALSDFAGRPLTLVRTDRPGDATDGYPVSIVSVASARELARRSGSQAALDSRRFRMMIEVDGCDPHEEDSWVGRQVRVGEATVRVARTVARCVITTLDPDTGVKDLETLQQIKAYRGLSEGNHIDFGVYAGVAEPGRIRVGDPVEAP